MSDSLKSSLAIRWYILKTSLAERMAYRGDFALGTLMRFLPIITQIFLWWAIFQSMNPTNPNEAHINGYSFQDMVAYYLLTMVGRAFSSMPGLSSNVATKIRDGEIKKFLVQPVDLISFLFWSRVAHKIAYYTVATLPFALVFFLCRSYFSNGFPDLITFGAFVASLLLSFALGFYLEACIGLVGFWMLEVSSLLFVYMLFQFFLSGHMFPLDILPEPWATIVGYLPIKYLAYFPAAVFLGKITGIPLAIDMGMLVLWTVFFFGLSRLAYHAGLKRYSGFGG
ncbi:MAG: ABC-2 family transporter protein [Planctomycetota bacterium]|jgi:ABC-2 type transport system permease protein|nr:ABC-2 family transporter protein [Planctomycetota bacterium]